jgi:hypothetical protein
MMVLVVCGQDIRYLSLGLVQDGALLQDVTVAAPPEQYLAAIDAAMRDWQVSPSDLSAVAVVTGPGSFTSSRVSTSLSNAIAFGKGIPVVSMENTKRLNLHELVRALDLLNLPPTDRFAVPVYDRPAHITNHKS